MSQRYFGNLPPLGLNTLSIAFGFFLICLGIRVAKSPELALKAANVQLNVSSSAKELKEVSQKLEEQTAIIKAKDEAYQELLTVYQNGLKGQKEYSKLQSAIENIEQLPPVENVEEVNKQIKKAKEKIELINLR